MILNIDTGKNEYKAMMSSRLPQLLDDAVKQARHLSLADLCDNLDIGAVFRWLPMAFPFDFGYEVNANPANSWGEVSPGSKKRVHGVARYPIDEWKKAGQPFMTVNSWCNFMRIIAHGKPELANIYDIAECFEDSSDQQHAYAEKTLKKWHLGKTTARLQEFLDHRCQERHGTAVSEGRCWIDGRIDRRRREAEVARGKSLG